ncbi:hypothetical protein BTVI_123776 [Pitangus sulphuratus]|nr:hypothetical protein BTVI_123776 [Pitangus sulphuratus]
MAPYAPAMISRVAKLFQQEQSMSRTTVKSTDGTRELPGGAGSSCQEPAGGAEVWLVLSHVSGLQKSHRAVSEPLLCTAVSSDGLTDLPETPEPNRQSPPGLG